jgi:hypothetical protein
MKVTLFALLASLVVITIALAPGGRTPAAEAATDYCGTAEVDVPDTGPSFDFTAACAAHDACYAQYHGTNETRRKMCDERFYSAMVKHCKDRWRWWQGEYYDCLTTASVYYAGVRLGGWVYFYG